MKPKKPAASETRVIVIEEDGNKTFMQKWGMRALGYSVIAHIIFIILAVFVFYRVVTPSKDAPPDFSALGGGGGGSSQTAHKVQAQTRKAMMSDQNRRITAAGASDFTLPEPTDSMTNVALPQFEEGGGTGGGSGGGNGTGKGVGNGSGTGAGSGNGKGGIFIGGTKNAFFFNQPLIGKRAVFVLDYSRSMQADNRQGILQDELKKTISGLQEGKEFQVILFAGYSWLPGDSVDLAADQMSATVKSSERTFEWVRPSRNSPDWLAMDGNNKHFVRPVSWQTVNAESLSQTVGSLENTKLQMGTCWEIPLEMALEMKPAPEVLFFMTDGVPNDSDTGKIVGRVINKAKGTKTVINAISMMEPDPSAIGPMKELAAKTGGGFSIVQKDGTSQAITKPKVGLIAPGNAGDDLR